MTRTGLALAFAFGLLIGLLAAPPVRAARADAEGRAYTVALIHDAAHDFQVDEGLLLRIAWCESRFEPNAYNAWSGATGVFQFLPSTWFLYYDRVERLWGPGTVPSHDPYDPRANVWLAAYVIRNHGTSDWIACR